MAYMSQEKKAELAPKIKAILKKNGLKGTLSVRDHLTLVLTISAGKIDFIRNCAEIAKKDAERRGDRPYITENDTYMNVNTYHVDSYFSGKAREVMVKLVTAMNEGNFDHSDIQSDYFSVGWYIDIKIGRYDRPYVVLK